MADTQLSSITNSLASSYGQTTSTTLSTKAGTLADPTNIGYVSNANTSLTAGNITVIGNVVASAGLSLNLEPAMNLVDCAMNLEDRIIMKAQEKAIELLMNNSTAQTVVGAVAKAQALTATVIQVIETVKNIKPLDLLTQLAIAKALQGANRAVKIQEILNTFGNSVNNLAEMINQLDVLDICSAPNYNANGTPIPPGLSSPAAVPLASQPTYPGATVNTSSVTAKDNYDALMLEVKGQTGKDFTKTSDPAYVSMVTSVNTIALAYHDKLMKNTSNQDDAKFAKEFNNSVQIELNIHQSQWNADIKTEYNNRCVQLAKLLNDGADIIRAYAMRNQIGPMTGSLISKGVTWYSGPYGDYTTFLDLRESERTPDLISHWQSKGRAVTGVRSGPLSLSDTTMGPFGTRLISDFSCASTRVPIDSVLALKNPDGTPYNPSGKNPNGIYTVHDTGSLPNTYNKPDIYTDTPEAYDRSNMGAVQVFLVSRGSREAPQYKLAQNRYGNQPVAV